MITILFDEFTDPLAIYNKSKVIVLLILLLLLLLLQVPPPVKEPPDLRNRTPIWQISIIFVREAKLDQTKSTWSKTRM